MSQKRYQVIQKVLKSLQLVLKGTRKGIGKVLEKILGPTIGTQKVLEKILNPTKRTEKVLQNEVQVLTNVNIPSSSSSSCVISVIIQRHQLASTQCQDPKHSDKVLQRVLKRSQKRMLDPTKGTKKVLEKVLVPKKVLKRSQKRYQISEKVLKKFYRY